MTKPVHAVTEPDRASAADPILQAHLDRSASGKMSVVELFQAAQQLTGLQRPDDTVTLYRNWLAHTPSPLAYAVHFNLGVSLFGLEDIAGAEQCYRQAIAIKPDFIEAHLNLGTLLEQRKEFDEALALWGKVPGYVKAGAPGDRALHVQALNNIGRLLEKRTRYTEAEEALERSLMLDPAQVNVITHWVHLRQKQCAWPIYKSMPGLTEEELYTGTSALAMLGASDDPTRQLAAAQRFVREKVPTDLPPMSNGSSYGHRKLRIGYLSGDFVSHAVSILTAELYELHDRARVEVYAFSWSHEDGTPLRSRVVSAMDHYIRIGGMTDEQAARCIREHEIDVLIDLQGLTLGTRPTILAHRPAPLQVAYLGFPGPSALPGVDYVIADRFVLPPELAPYFTEKPLYMPHTFQINDRKRLIGPTPTRASCALPEDAFVFCSFNSSFKITEEVFGAWMRILKQVPGSVLWLVSDHASVQDNLRRAAGEQGVASERLIFATRTGPADYLARYQVADLFLDTFPFNAGTTASDALWAGLPLLTYSGRPFASRMAGSLLHAVDLPELVTFSLAEYEQKAVALAADPARIAAMKQQLRDNRLTCKLFDSPGFVRDLEDVLTELAATLPAPAPGGPKLVPAVSSAPAAPAGSVAQPSALQLPQHTPISDPSRVVSFTVRMSWGLSDPHRFYQLVEQALELATPGVYLGDNMMTWGRNNSLFEDQAFVAAWSSNQQNDADQAIAWRRYILACAAYHCAQLDGDFVECGVYRGTGIKTVIDYFGKDNFNKTFWGYDTYDYNPVEKHAFDGQEDGLYDEIQRRFEGYTQVRLVKGLLPQSLQNNSPAKIAYMHIDLNSAKYEIAVLDELFDRMVPGGVLILDDYEWAGVYREQKVLEDAWFEQRKYRVFPLPTGQGLVLKR
jgi:predicted O-linked N-acetylglucosamine transferase (SPINDLY family)